MSLYWRVLSPVQIRHNSWDTLYKLVRGWQQFYRTTNTLPCRRRRSVVFFSPFFHYTNLVTIALWRSNTHTSAPSEVWQEMVWVNIGAFCLKWTPGTWDAEPRPRQTLEFWCDFVHRGSFALRASTPIFYANYVSCAVYHADSRYVIYFLRGRRDFLL